MKGKSILNFINVSVFVCLSTYDYIFELKTNISQIEM